LGGVRPPGAQNAVSPRQESPPRVSFCYCVQSNLAFEMRDHDISRDQARDAQGNVH